MSTEEIQEAIDSQKYPFANPDADIPRNSLFKELRRMWMEEDDSRKSQDLAKMLEVRPQHVSQWASGSDRRIPPWWAIMRLCKECNKKITLSAGEIRIVQADDVVGGIE
tara:strand:+ start:531 stop:857 length:327 start_codon:yes stop_codon:yes gene_type:complete